MHHDYIFLSHEIDRYFRQHHCFYRTILRVADCRQLMVAVVSEDFHEMLARLSAQLPSIILLS
jgi:hypothetical protein